MKQELMKKEENKIEKIDRHYEPEVDIYETENEIVCIFDMPGTKKDKIKVNFEKSRLTVEAEAIDYINKKWSVINEEYRIYNYKRMLTFADVIDPNKIEASYEDGVLKVVLHKKQEVKPKAIEIQVK